MTQEQRNGTTPGSWQSSLSSFSFPLSGLGGHRSNGPEPLPGPGSEDCQELPVVTSWSGHRSNGTEPLLGPGSPHSHPSASRCHVLERTQEQRNGTTPGSWQSSLSSFSFPLSRLGADTGATERNHSWVLAVLTLLLQLPVVTSWSGHRSNGTEPLLDPGSPHSPSSASRCHVLEWTQEQRNGTTPGSWQSSLSSFSFPLSRLGADTGATERNHPWVLAVLLQLPVVTSWSGHRSNGTEPPLGPGSPPSASRCHVFELTQEQRNGTTPGSWQSSFSFPLSRLGADTVATERNHSWVLAVLTLLLQLPVVRSWSGHSSNGTEPLLGPGSPHSLSFPSSLATERNSSFWQFPFLHFPLSWSGHSSNGTEPLLGPGSPHSPSLASRCHVLERTQEQRNGTTPGSWQSSFSFPLSRLGADTGATERNHSWVLAVLTLLLQLPVVTSWSGHRSNGTEPLLGPGSPHSPPSASRCQVLVDTGATERNHSWVLAVLTLILQLPVVTSWSGNRSNGTESLLGPGSPHSPPSASRCHVLERTQEQRNGTTPGSWQSSFSFPLSRLGADTGATERNHPWVLAVLLQLPVVMSLS